MRSLLRFFCLDRQRVANTPNFSDRRMSKISAAELASLIETTPERVIIFDLRDYDAVALYPFAIPGALPAFRVDVEVLLHWVPPESVVVLYATDAIPASFACIHLVATKLNFRVLEGGLGSWRDAGFPMEYVSLGHRWPVNR
jgi:rhodanese-related sulfurtransferase